MSSKEKGDVLFIISIILSASFIILFGIYFYSSREIDIKYPRLGNPAILNVNSTYSNNLSIKVSVPFGSNLQNAKFRITNEKKTYELDYTLINYFNEIAVFNLNFPSDTNFQEGLYDLYINIDDLSTDEPHAIQILEEIPISFSFIIIADPHINPDVPEYQTQFQKVIEEINLINPDFVLCVGDIADLSRRIEWEMFYDFILQLKVPSFIIEGNHDLGDLNVYYELFSDLYFSFDYGNFHFIGLNSGDKYSNPLGAYTQWNYLETELETHQNSIHNYIFVHIPPYDDFEYPNSDLHQKFFDICDEYSIDAVFSGHIHKDEIRDRYGNILTNFSDPAIREKTSYIVTTTTAKTDNPGYRMVDIDGYKGVVKCSYDKNNNSLQDEIDSIPYNNLNYNFTNNDGIMNYVNLSINNNLYQEFFGAKFDFRLNKNNSTKYIVSYGNIIEVNELNSYYLISVLFNIPESSKIEINIKEE